MPPPIPNPENTTTVDSSGLWYQPLCKITPLSKYFAMLIFILMPFVGGYVGYSFALKSQIHGSTTILQQPLQSPSLDKQDDGSSSSNEMNNPVIIPSTPNVLSLNQINKSSSTIRFATRESLGEYFDEEGDFINFVTVENIKINEDTNYVSNLPFLTVVATTTDRMFLTRHCFKATECSFLYLYELNLSNSVLTEMNVSKLYDETHSGSLKLDNSLFVVTSPYSSTSSDLFVIDLSTDEAYSLDSFIKESESSFCIPGLGCELDVTRLAERKIEAVIYTSLNIYTRDYNVTTSTKQYTW